MQIWKPILASCTDMTLSVIWSLLLFKIYRTSVQYATYYSSFWKMKVLETESRQTLVFDPGGSTGYLCACPFLGACRALLCGEVFVWAPDGTRGWSVFGRWMTWNINFRKRGQAIRTYRSSPNSQADTGSRQNPTARDYVSHGEKWMSRNAME